jgi:DNA-binding CsgD family transcriptional regulator
MAAPTEDTPYLGHEATLERAAALLDRAAAGSGAWAVLLGESGGGTSATAREIARRAAAAGISVAWGACRPGLGGRPFEALAGALEELAGRTPAATLYADLAEGAPVLARLAPAIRRVLPAVPPPAPLDPPDELLRLDEAVLGWLARASEMRPLLLVLEDFQWADHDLARLIRRIAERVAGMPVLVLGVVAANPDEPVTQTQLPGEPVAIPLGALDEGATGALLARHADSPISAPALRLIQHLSGGRPLAAIELYRHLREEGHIGRPGGDVLPAPEELPATVEDVVAWRLARSTLEQRSALAALACFPRPATAAAVASVAGLARARAAEALEASFRRGLVASVEGTGLYEIGHHRIRRAITGGISANVRAEAFARIAQVIEEDLGSDARREAAALAALYGDALATLSNHAGALGQARAATGVRHCLVAAEQARAAAAYRRAADVHDLAQRLAAVAGLGSRQELTLRLAVARAEAGQPEPALDAARQALSNAADAEALEMLVQAARTLRDHGRGEAAAELASLLAQGDGDDLTRARLELIAGHWRAVSAAGLRALVWELDETDAERVLLEKGDEADRSELFAPQRPRGHEQTVRLLNLARDWRRPASLLRAMLGGTVDLSTRLGLFREGASWAGEYLAAAERYGSPRDRARALLLHARCQAVLGDFEAARSAIVTADDALERLPDPSLAAERVLAGLALTHYLDDDWSALTERTDALSAQAQPAGLLIGAEAALARARTGQAPEAAAILEPALEMIEQWPPLTYLRDGALMVALATAWECGWAEYSARGRSLAGLAAAAGAGGNHAGTPSLATARMYGLAGRLADAQSAFSAAREELDAAGLRPLRAIADHDEGVALAAAGPAQHAAAAPLLEAAAGRFEELGMLGWFERTRALIGGLGDAAAPGGRLHFTYPRGLSRREAELVRLLSDGTPLVDAAAVLEIEEAVAQRHLAAAMTKLGATTTEELAGRARRYGLGGGA